ncbi:MAG: hypothetical protein M0D57_04600 [Sphingobacteriales bacterium JAD_PAG50586_3]|nr:MAG: hypothetical protein M0D57_04600 [Sphingobacteriales bacterium JAD_PAG50586_3]
MLQEIKESVTKTISERIYNPLYGSLIISWSFWNWKIIYLTLFVSQDAIKPYNKIDYIIMHYGSSVHIIVLPILSTLMLIVIFPYFSLGAHYMTLYFKRQRNKLDENYKKFIVISQIDFKKQVVQQNYKIATLQINILKYKYPPDMVIKPEQVDSILNDIYAQTYYNDLLVLISIRIFEGSGLYILENQFLANLFVRLGLIEIEKKPFLAGNADLRKVIVTEKGHKYKLNLEDLQLPEYLNEIVNEKEKSEKDSDYFDWSIPRVLFSTEENEKN